MKIKQSGVAENSILLAFVKIVTTVLGMITTKVLCMVLTKTEYGTYSQVLLVVSTICSLTILGMTDAVNYFYNKHRNTEKADEYVATIFFMQFIASIVGMLVIILGKTNIIEFFNNSALNQVFIFAGIIPFLLNLLSMLQVLFISIGKAKEIAYRNLIISVANLMFFSLGCYLVHEIYILLVITVILDVLQIIYFVWMLKKNGMEIRIKNLRLKYVSGILTYCVPMAMFILMNSLSRDLDKYVVSAFADTESLAMYSNASRILPFDIIMTSFVTILLPTLTRYISKKNYKEARMVYSDFVMISCLSTMLLAAGAIALAPEIMTFLYSSQYLEAYPIFIIYILIDIVRFLSLSLVLSAAGWTKILMKISICSLLANAIFNVLFYKILGLLGPAIVTLIIMLIMGITMLHYNAKILQCKIGEIINLKELAKNICIIVILCVIEMCIKRLLESIITNYFIKLVCAYSVYALLAVILFGKKIMFYFSKLNRIE